MANIVTKGGVVAILLLFILSCTQKSPTESPAEEDSRANEEREAYLSSLYDGCYGDTAKENFEKAEKCIDYARETNAKTLSLSGLGLSELPDKFDGLESLELLDVSKNLLTSLPVSFKALNNLKTFLAPFNELDKIPLGLVTLPSLSTVHLSHNSISEIPIELNELSSLRFLNVSSNPLEKLPESLESLTSLQMIEMNNVRLESFPGVFGTIPNLLYLTMNENKDLFNNASIPKNLKSIRGLSIKDSGLKAVPSILLQLKELRYLNLAGNDIVSVPVELSTLPHLSEKPGEIVAPLFRGTYLPEFDEKSLKQLDAFRGLDINSNKIEQLDFSFCKFGFIELLGNPLSNESYANQCKEKKE